MDTYIAPLEAFVENGAISDEMRYGIDGFVTSGVADAINVDGQEWTDGDCLEAIALLTDLWRKCVYDRDFYGVVDNQANA